MESTGIGLPPLNWLSEAQSLAFEELSSGHHPFGAVVFARGQKAIEVIGPVAAMEEEIAVLHVAFWSSPTG